MPRVRVRSESKVSTTSSAAVKLQAAFEGGQAGGFDRAVLTFESHAPGLVEKRDPSDPCATSRKRS